MDLNWFESFLYGLFSGLTDILPVSAEAHRILMLKCFGIQSHTELMKLFAHLGVFGAMYFSCRKQIVRIHRARRLARVPKRRRRRPLDTRSLMDFSLLRTMLIPVILGFFLNRYTEPLKEKLIWIAALLFLNGIILYIPQFFSTGNRDSRMLSRVEGLLVGLGGALGILPGISCLSLSVATASEARPEHGADDEHVHPGRPDRAGCAGADVGGGGNAVVSDSRPLSDDAIPWPWRHHTAACQLMPFAAITAIRCRQFIAGAWRCLPLF